jgi:hypothetical protein
MNVVPAICSSTDNTNIIVHRSFVLSSSKYISQCPSSKYTCCAAIEYVQKSEAETNHPFV